MTWGIVCALTAWPLGVTHAAEAADAAPATEPAAAPAAAPAAETAPASLDFDFFGDTPAPEAPPAAVDPELAAAAQSRRSMLETHQILGLTTLGVMAVTTVLGQLDYNDLYSKDSRGTGNYLWPKRIGAYTTTGLFIATGTYALLAPTPYEQEGGGVDTGVLHRVLVSGAAAGMVTQIALGFVTARRADAGNIKGRDSMMRAHQVVGYATLGLMSGAALVWVF